MPRISILKDVIAGTMSVLSKEELEQLCELSRPLLMNALEMLHMKLKPSLGSPKEVTMPVKSPGGSDSK